MDIKKISKLSMLISISVIINILESFIPLTATPGFKIGLANVINIYVLYKYSFKGCLYVSFIRVILVGILFSGLFSSSFFFSLGGSILSTIMMYLVKKIKIFSIIGVSVVGSISHNIGQVLVGIILVNYNVIYYLPYLLLFSIPTGIVTGIISKILLDRLKVLDN